MTLSIGAVMTWQPATDIEPLVTPLAARVPQLDAILVPQEEPDVGQVVEQQRQSLETGAVLEWADAD
jgi:hypothetical protein